jgi:hypothetical protein
MGQQAAASASDAPGSTRRRRGRWAFAIAAVLLLAPGSVRAATALSSPQVSPRSVVQGGLVTFTVDTTGNANVTVQVELVRAGAATIVEDLAIIGKSNSTTTWQFQSTAIPAGTWAVTFAIAASTTTLAAGTLTVSPPPTPTATPGPTATPRPTPARTATPRPTPARTATPAGNPTPSATTSAAATPTGAAAGSAAGSGSPVASGTGGPGVVGPASSAWPAGSGATAGSIGDDRIGPLLLSVLLGLFVIGGVAGIAILTARRRGEEEPAAALAPAATAFVATPGESETAAFRQRAQSAAPQPAARRRASWEVYSALEDEPIGTVDELATDPRSGSPGAEPSGDGRGGEEG